MHIVVIVALEAPAVVIVVPAVPVVLAVLAALDTGLLLIGVQSTIASEGKHVAIGQGRIARF